MERCSHATFRYTADSTYLLLRMIVRYSRWRIFVRTLVIPSLIVSEMKLVFEISNILIHGVYSFSRYKCFCLNYFIRVYKLYIYIIELIFLIILIFIFIDQ